MFRIFPTKVRIYILVGELSLLSGSHDFSHPVHHHTGISQARSQRIIPGFIIVQTGRIHDAKKPNENGKGFHFDVLLHALVNIAY